MTETAALADVVLPAASFLEKDGTFTNTERRIKRARKVIDSPGEALTDGEIIVRLSRRSASRPTTTSPSDIMNEMSAVTPQYGGVSYRRLEAEGELQLAVPRRRPPRHRRSCTPRRSRAAWASSRPSTTCRPPSAPTPSGRSCSPPAATCGTSTPTR